MLNDIKYLFEECTDLKVNAGLLQSWLNKIDMISHYYKFLLVICATYFPFSENLGLLHWGLRGHLSISTTSCKKHSFVYLSMALQWWWYLCVCDKFYNHASFKKQPLVELHTYDVNQSWESFVKNDCHTLKSRRVNFRNHEKKTCKNVFTICLRKPF